LTDIQVVDAICGIYKITNRENGKVYVGSSKNILKRWEQHKAHLKKGSHHSAKLQHAWNANGKYLDLDFEVLEVCLPEVIFVREQEWMDKLLAYKEGYNCSKSAVYPTSRIKTSLKVKYSKEFDQICELLHKWSKMADVFPREIVVSFFGTGAGNATTDSAYIKRYLKALKMCIRITQEGETLDKDTEYRLHYINYIGKEADYAFSPEYNTSKGAKWSIHTKNKAPDLYSRLWEDMLCSLGGRVGREITARYERYVEEVESIAQ